MPGGSGAYDSSPEKIRKMWCSLVRFGVYFDQIEYALYASLEKFPKYFYIKHICI